MAQELSRADIKAAFTEVGEILVRAKKVAEVAVYGGAAIMLQFDVEFRTGDVDVTVESGDHGALMAAVHSVATRRGWLRSWFSESVAMYVSGQAGTSFHRSYPSAARTGLRVYVATPDYLLAMKLQALRTASRDRNDAAMLARATGITTADGMLELLGRYFPKDAPSPERIVIIHQFAATLDAPSS